MCFLAHCVFPIEDDRSAGQHILLGLSEFPSTSHAETQAEKAMLTNFNNVQRAAAELLCNSVVMTWRRQRCTYDLSTDPRQRGKRFGEADFDRSSDEVRR